MPAAALLTANALLGMIALGALATLWIVPR
jgi:hypothetical protein